MGSEDIELDAEHRRYLDDVHGRLGAIDHYALLGVPRDADKKTIKNAYYRIAASVHPDRHFKKKLGPYKAKMETIFVRLEDAYRTLTAPDARKAYDATLGAAAPPPANAALDPKLAAKRKAALDALKERFEAARTKAEEVGKRAEIARAAGDLDGALRLHREAVSILPSDAKLRAALDDVTREAAAKLADGYARKAALEERFGRWEAAADSWRRVVDARPDDVEAKRRLAAALAQVSRRP